MPEASTRTERDSQTHSLQPPPPQVGDSKRVTRDIRGEISRLSEMSQKEKTHKDAEGSETDWVPVANLLVWFCIWSHTLA